MIQISFNGTDQRVVKVFQERGPLVVEQLTRTMNSLMLKLQRKVVTEKLSGQVLQHRTGKGAASVNVEPVESRGAQIIGRVTAGAGPAFYMRIQEKGGTGPYQIMPRNKKALAFFPGGTLGAGGGITPVSKAAISGLYKKGSLRPSKLGKFGEFGGVVVKSVQHPPLPARPFMSTSLAEMREEIVDRLRQSFSRALEGGG